MLHKINFYKILFSPTQTEKHKLKGENTLNYIHGSLSEKTQFGFFLLSRQLLKVISSIYVIQNFISNEYYH